MDSKQTMSNIYESIIFSLQINHKITQSPPTRHASLSIKVKRLPRLLLTHINAWAAFNAKTNTRQIKALIHFPLLHNRELYYTDFANLQTYLTWYSSETFETFAVLAQLPTLWLFHGGCLSSKCRLMNIAGRCDPRGEKMESFVWKSR